MTTSAIARAALGANALFSAASGLVLLAGAAHLAPWMLNDTAGWGRPILHGLGLGLVLFAGMLVIGLLLRFIMREWTAMFRILAEGPNAEVEDKLEKSLRFGDKLAYTYWVGILSIAFLGATKPF